MMQCFICNKKYKKFTEFRQHFKEEHVQYLFEKYEEYEEYKKLEQDFFKEHIELVVQCSLCKKYLRQITEYHLKPVHNITLQQYKVLFPNDKLISQNILERLSYTSSSRKISSKTKKQMSESRKKYLSMHDYIPPVLKMNKQQKEEFRKKVSITTTEAMKRPEVLKRMVENRKDYAAWNKGKKTSEESKQKRLKTLHEHFTNEQLKELGRKIRKTINQRYSKEQQLEWSRKGGLAAHKDNQGIKIINRISSFEKIFLDELEKELQSLGVSKIVRQRKMIVNDQCRFIDGYIDSFQSFKILIEIDGVYWHSFESAKHKDLSLDDYCSRKLKYKLFRFTDEQIIRDKRKCIEQVINFITDMAWFYDLKNSHLTNYQIGEALYA